MTKKKTAIHYDPDFVNKQRKVLAKATSGTGEHYFVINGANKVVERPNVSCFGGFHYIKSEGHVTDNWGAEVLLVNHPGATDTPAIRAFINWCVNESPYADVFIDKDVDYIMDNPIAISCRFHARMVIGAAILIRYRSNMIARVNMWYQMVKRGVSPDMAFHLCHHFESYNKDGFILNGDGGGHGLWHPHCSRTSIRNWLAHEPVGLGEADRTVHGGYFSYTGLWNAWGPVESYSSEQLQVPAADDVKESKSGWGKHTTRIGIYTWKNLDNFIEAYCKANKLTVKYAESLERFDLEVAA